MGTAPKDEQSQPDQHHCQPAPEPHQQQTGNAVLDKQQHTNIFAGIFPECFHQRTGRGNGQRRNGNPAQTACQQKAACQQPDHIPSLCLIQLHIRTEADQQHQYYAEHRKRSTVGVFQNPQFFLLRTAGIESICRITEAVQMNAAGDQHTTCHCQHAKQHTADMQQAADQPDQPQPYPAEQPHQREKHHCIPQIFLSPVQTLYRNRTIHGKCDQQRFQP